MVQTPDPACGNRFNTTKHHRLRGVPSREMCPRRSFIGLFAIALFICNGASAATVAAAARAGAQEDGWRIMGGSTAAPAEFPWQAQLKKDGVHVCGGVLLTEQWVATAAHCLTSPDLTAYQVILGEYDVTVDDGTEQKTGVSKVVFHQSAETQTSGRSDPSAAARGGRFDPSAAARGGDLAMLKLEKAVTITKAVRPLPLPAPDEDFTGQVGVTAGWGVSGSTIISPTYPKILQKLKMTILDDDVCLKDLSFFNYVPETMSCATPATGSSLCWGDSGGALVYYKSADSPRLAAVVSWAVECNLEQLPSVFVEAAAYVKWITEVIT